MIDSLLKGEPAGIPLRLAESLNLRFSSGVWRIESRSGSIEGRELAILIIRLFAFPQTVEQAISQAEALGVSSELHREFYGLITEMLRFGILVSAQGSTSSLSKRRGSFDGADVHVRMLNDTARTFAFREAIKATVKTGDVVLDIGSGTGVLALFAAQAGAKKVYAIERSPVMASLARKFAERNGFADRIEVIEGNSTYVEVPEKADVVIAELIGNDPLSERLLPVLMDACQRHTIESPRLIPSKLLIYAIPVEVEESHFSSLDQLQNWRSAVCNLGLRVAPEWNSDSPAPTCDTWVLPQNSGGWRELSEPQELVSLDLRSIKSDMIATRRTMRFDRDGLFNAILICFSLEVAAGIAISTIPDAAARCNHWLVRIWRSPKQFSVSKGQRIEIDYSFDRTVHSQFHVRET